MTGFPKDPPPPAIFHQTQKTSTNFERIMAIYFPAFIQGTRTSRASAHMYDFVQGFMSAFEHRFFSFSSYTASIFFDPSTTDHFTFCNAIYNGYEQISLTDSIDSILVSFEDVTTRRMPMWARDDVLPLAQHFTRSSGITHAPFVATLQHRFFADANVQKLLAASSRGPTAASDLRNILYAFASVVLLTKALTQTRSNLVIDPTHTPMMAVYLQRVIERFHAEPQITDFVLRFNGPVNQGWMVDGQPLYDPVRPSTKEAQQDLCRAVVGAYRALTCSTAPAREILGWTQVVLNSFHTHPASMWAASQASSARAPPPPPPPPQPVATAATAAHKPAAAATVTTTTKTPKTPKTPQTPKSTLRFETALDNF